MTGRNSWLCPPLVLGMFLALGLALVWDPPAAAHGVALIAEEGTAVVVTGAYSDGELMSYAKAKIVGPDGKTYQLGNADAGGCFAFLADRPGEWRVTFADGMGHKAEVTWQQNPAGKATGPAPSPQPPTHKMEASKWERAIWGLSLLFWLSGLVFWRKGVSKARQG
jgi:hypothetical protein